MKKAISLFTAVILLLFSGFNTFATNGINTEAEATTVGTIEESINAESALLMEAETGEVLLSKNENERRSPASVTKIMTLLLVMEAIEDGRISTGDIVTVSEHAASMGGSQVFLEAGEEMSVEELVKCTVIASANDAALTLAELVYGSEGMFVTKMNERAKELGMENSNFENVTGLDDTTTNHYTSALDIAIMSRELIKYDLIKKYSTLWQDTIRDGSFTLTNTNRLVRYYDGCNGLKTGSTDKAGFCLSATAKRGDMQLIAVIMGSPNRDARNNAARALLDYGFSNFAIYKCERAALENTPVYNGKKDTTTLYSTGFSRVIPKGSIKKVEAKYEIPDHVCAPFKSGDVIGKITYTLNGEILGTADIIVVENIEKTGFLDIFIKILTSIFTN